MTSGRVNPKFRLDDQGISGLGNVYYNYLEPALIQEALKRDEGTLGQGGAFLVTTGKFTGRSPKDKEHLSPYAGGTCRVTVSYQRMDASVRLRLGDHWSLKVNHDLLRQLRKWLGEEAVKIRMGVPGTEITTSSEPEMA